MGNAQIVVVFGVVALVLLMSMGQLRTKSAMNLTPQPQTTELDWGVCEAEHVDWDEYVPLPNADLHAAWMVKNVSRERSLHKKIRLHAAYRFPQHIAVEITSLNLHGATVYCHYYDCNRQKIGKPRAAVVFPETTIYCPRRPGTKFVSLTKYPKNTPDAPIPLIDRTMKRPKHFLSVCIAPMYGSEAKWLHIAEFVEHYKLQGATWFYFYVVDLDQYSRHMLDDYQRRGEIEVVNLHDGLNRTNRLWHMVQIHDCLQRSRGFSQWTAFVDIDERLVMNSTTIRSYLNHLNNDTIASVQFRQKWILKEEPLPATFIDEAQLLEWMPTRRNTNGSSFGPPGHTAKCIVRPEKIGAMFIHSPFAMYPGFQQLQIEPEMGYVRHYRDVNLGDWGKRWLGDIRKFGPFATSYLDPTLSRRLTRAVVQRVIAVYKPA